MKHKEWFETWFDSPYYHVLYQHRDEAEAEHFMDKLLLAMHLSPGARALDVACGKGRHAVYLAEKGMEVTGIDLSWKNIGHAVHYERPNLSFFLHDMRNPFYINYFDVVFNLFTSFGYFETEKENLKAIHSMSMAMKKGGKLVIEFEERVQSLRYADFERLFRQNGLKITSVYGDYQLHPFEEPLSDRMIIVAEKT